MLTSADFETRRQFVAEKLLDNSVLILYAGVAKKCSADENFPFVVNRNFFYLTNIQQEGSILVITKKLNEVKSYLFISEFNEVKEKWTGIRLTSAQAEKLSGIENIMYLNTFENHIDMLLDKNNKSFGEFNNVYLDLEEENKIGPKTTTLEVKKELNSKYKKLKFFDIYKTLCELRCVKTSNEVEEHRQAISKTQIGLNKILNALKPGLYEYQLSSLFYYAIQDFDHSELAFSTIVAGGKNATILHYPNASEKLNDGDLVLLDLGARSKNYCADISRTYPVNGKFSDKQKQIYQIVLDCNKMIARNAKPGLTLVQLQELAKNFLAKKCVEAGLISNVDEITKVYYHSVSHHIGLDTHEPWDRNEPLVPGNIISDEPGLYFKEFGIGVRIEDDLLITEDGCYVLSNGIPKEIEDIEKIMARR